MDIDRKQDLEDYLNAVESQLNLIESTPLTDGGAYPWSKEMVNEQLFLQNQIDVIEEELDDMDEDTLSLESLKPIKAVIPKGKENSDRTYILGLCDEILGEVSLRQYPYQFLVKNSWVSVDVDAYYMAHNLIIEYFCGCRRRELPNDGTPIINISFKDFGTSRKLKRDETKDKCRLCYILQSHIGITY